MSSADVRSILNLPQSGPAHAPAPRKAALVQRPKGISRELYALIGDNAPSLADAQASVAAVKYRERPTLKGQKVKWEWTDFTPEGRGVRGDRPSRLGHWVRTSDQDKEASVKYFAKFNQHGPSVMEYSQFEYDQHLADPDWTPHETAYLFDLLREFDLRFVVAADRYAYKDPKSPETVKHRSVEEMKDRYYTICRRLVRTRTTTDAQAQQQLIQAYTFDKNREIKRKQYASGLFHLTAAEISEEEALYIEIKRLEQNERRYRAERDDLLRTVMGLDSGLVNVDNTNIDNVLGADKNKKRKRPEEETAPPSPVPVNKVLQDTSLDGVRCIYRAPPSANPHLAPKYPIHVPVFLRSTKLPQPKALQAEPINQILAELGISSTKLVMPTRNNMEEFEGLLVAASALVEMKRQVDRVQQELRTLRAQKEGFIPPVDAAVNRIRSASVASTDTAQTGRQSRQP